MQMEHADPADTPRCKCDLMAASRVTQKAVSAMYSAGSAGETEYMIMQAKYRPRFLYVL